MQLLFCAKKFSVKISVKSMIIVAYYGTNWFFDPVNNILENVYVLDSCYKIIKVEIQINCVECKILEKVGWYFQDSFRVSKYLIKTKSVLYRNKLILVFYVCVANK